MEDFHVLNLKFFIKKLPMSLGVAQSPLCVTAAKATREYSHTRNVPDFNALFEAAKLKEVS
jgi:hypothetical protein